MTTQVWALSAEGDPEFIYYEDRCMYKVRVPMPNGSPVRTLAGTVLTADQFTEYNNCEACQADHVNNTLYVTYE